MVVHRGDGSDRHGWLRLRLSQVTGLALGIAMLGTIGLSGTLAQDEDVVAGSDAESIVNAIIQQVFAEIFGDATIDDDAAGLRSWRHQRRWQHGKHGHHGRR